MLRAACGTTNLLSQRACWVHEQRVVFGFVWGKEDSLWRLVILVDTVRGCLVEWLPRYGPGNHKPNRVPSIMIHFECLQCSRRHKVNSSMAGAKVKCPCGQVMLVPAAPSSTFDSAQPNPPSSDGKVMLNCACGKTLRVSAAAIGKSVRCPCGEVLTVTSPQDVSFAGAENEVSDPFFPSTPQGSLGAMNSSNDWLSDALPATPAPTYPAAGGYAAYGSGGAYGSGSAYGSTSPSRGNSPYSPTYSSDYMRTAEKETKARRAENQSDITVEGNAARWALIIIGLLTIFFNIVWFINIEHEIAGMMQEAAANGEFADVDFLRVVGRILYGITILVGVVLVILGGLVPQFPIAAPAIGLAIYVSGILLFLLLDPMSLVSPVGIFVKLAVISALVKAIISGVQAKSGR